MLKSQSYNPAINFRSSNSPPFPLQSIPMQNHHHLQHHQPLPHNPHYLSMPHTATSASFPASFNPSSNSTSTSSNNPAGAGPIGFQSLNASISATSPPHGGNSNKNLQIPALNASISLPPSSSPSSASESSSSSLSSSSSSSSSSPPSTSTLTPTNISSASNGSSISNSASASTNDIMSHNVSASSFFPSASGFQPFIPSQYNQASNSSASFTSSNLKTSPSVLPLANTSSMSLSQQQQQPPQQPQSQQQSQANQNLYYSNNMPIMFEQDASPSTNYPCLRVLNLPRDILEREFEIMFTFAADFLGSELQKSRSVADDGLPASVVGIAYFKTVTAATNALTTLNRNSHVFTPKEVLARPRTLSSSQFALKIDLLHNNRLSVGESPIASLNSFTMGGPSQQSSQQSSQQQPQNQSQPPQQGPMTMIQSQQSQFKPVSRFVFPGSNGQQQPPHSAPLDMPPSFTDMFDVPANGANGGFPPAYPRSMFPTPVEDYNAPRVSGKSLLLESQGREDEEYNAIVKDVGWFSQGPLNNSNPMLYSSSGAASNGTQNQISSPVGYNGSSSIAQAPQPPSAPAGQSSSQQSSPPQQKAVPKQPASLSIPQQPQGAAASSISPIHPKSSPANGSPNAATSAQSSLTTSPTQKHQTATVQSSLAVKGKLDGIQSKGPQTGPANGVKHGAGRLSNGSASNPTNPWGTNNGDGSSGTTVNGSNSAANNKKNRNSTIRTSFQGMSLNGTPSGTPSGPSATMNGSHHGSSGGASGVTSPTPGAVSSGLSSASNGAGGSPSSEGPKVVVVPFAQVNGGGSGGAGSGNGPSAIHIMQTGNRVLPAANPADQNPPCNTLYVGNLPPDTNEEELKTLFSARRGYKRLCFRTKANGPMCFVEFDDVNLATRALEELYGHTLSNSVKGGIRLSFSKNPLGVRSQPNGGSGNSASGGGSASGGSSANNASNVGNNGNTSGGSGGAGSGNNLAGGVVPSNTGGASNSATTAGPAPAATATATRTSVTSLGKSSYHGGSNGNRK